MDRISSNSVHKKTVAEMSRLQVSLADAQRRMSSGQKYDSFIGLGTQINRIQDMENSINRADRYRDNNTVAITRLDTMDLSVEQIQDVAEDLKSALATENSSSAGTFELAEFARNALKVVESALNTTQAGRSLFAGSKTDQPAVGDLTVTNLVNNEATGNYYHGDAFITSVQASDTLNVNYGITADNSAFQKIIGALHKAIDLDSTGDHRDALAASDLIEEAVLGLADVRTSIQNDRVTLLSTNNQHNAVQTQLNSAYSKLVGNDVEALIEASIEASLNQATLTATMQTFARISSLSLVDFLR